MGNLRTAIAAWVAARTSGREFLIRFEDLDPATSDRGHEARQLADLAAIGIGSTTAIVRQSERFERYRAVLTRLEADDLVYPCFCTRREIAAEIAAAVNAPHGPRFAHAAPPSARTANPLPVLEPDGAYPGTCAALDRATRARRARSRPAALRLRAGNNRIEFDDRRAGRCIGTVDDFVVRRADGIPAYNLAVVVDDAAQQVSQVVRGDDLLASTPRQIHLQGLLGLPTPEYLHVPLVLGADGARLAKRHGAVTMSELVAGGHPPSQVLAALARSLGFATGPDGIDHVDELVARCDDAWVEVPPHPIVFDELGFGSSSGPH